MRARGNQPSSLNMVLEASFDALAERKQKEVLRTAVLAAADRHASQPLGGKGHEGYTREAEGLVSKSLLQNIGGGGKCTEAGPFYERSQAICEEVFGPRHPRVAESLNTRAILLDQQGKHAEAEPLNERATEIWEKALGPDTPAVATLPNNRAVLLKEKARYEEAKPLHKR